MERGFLSLKGSGGGRGVKEKSRGSINVSAEVKNGVDEGMTTSSNVATNTQGSVNDTTQVTGVMPYDADGPVRVDENVRQKPSNSTDNPNKGGNGLDVVVPVESIRAISERFANTAYGFFLGKCVALPVVANYFSSMEGLYAILENDPWFICNNLLILIKWKTDVNLLKEDDDVELKDNIVVVMPKLVGGRVLYV
ncbi:hypothetical protein Tco_1034638 [Tanacetum coccineum]